MHQQEALAALAAAWTAGKTRAWVALPPGAGKTLVGLMTVRDRVAAGVVGKAVVLGPNTAIQGQWAAQATALGIDVGTDRSLEHQLTALTYQALAVFDPDDEVDDDGTEPSLLMSSNDGSMAVSGAEPSLLMSSNDGSAPVPVGPPSCWTGCTRTAGRSSSSCRHSTGTAGRCCWSSTSATTCSRCGVG